MRTLILFISSVALLGINTGKINAQCTVSNIVIQNVTGINSATNSCTVKFDASFNIENNNGNKYIFINAWLQNDYPDYFKCSGGKTTLTGSIAAPKAADLGHTLISLGLGNNDPLPVILKSYPPDTTVPMATMDSAKKQVMPNGTTNFILYGVVATAPVPCGIPVVIVTDLWSSQSSGAQRVHCINCGIRYSAGFLDVAGAVDCVTHTYNGTIKNITAISISGYYTVFADVKKDGFFTMSDDTLLKASTSFNLSPGATIGIIGTLPPANVNQNIFVVVTQTTGTATAASRVFLFPSGICAPAALPVTFISFTATRNSSSEVLLKWQTSAEINNIGFNVERYTGNGKWDMAGFIPSQAPGGNGGYLLQYSFNDANSNKGVTQYRIKQIDIDGRTTYTDIQSVRGDAQKSKILIYPNPVVNGHLTVILEEGSGVNDITLSDLNGHTLNHWKGITTNTLEIENLRTGIYILKVNSLNTGNQTVERIIVL